jgi:hypothetical protein
MHILNGKLRKIVDGPTSTGGICEDTQLMPMVELRLLSMLVTDKVLQQGYSAVAVEKLSHLRK